MSFPKTIFRFPSAEMSERVEDRTMNCFRSTLNPRVRVSYWEEEKKKKSSLVNNGKRKNSSTHK